MKLLILYTDTSGNQSADVMDCYDASPVETAMMIMRTYSHVDETKPMFVIQHRQDVVLSELSVLDKDGYEIDVGDA